MTEMMTRRRFFDLALAVVSIAVAEGVTAAYAGQPTGQATGKRAHKPIRTRMYYRNANTDKKKVTSGACIPGEPDYDPDQCYQDIKD